MNTQLLYVNLIPLMWLTWLLYWRAAASGVKKTQRRESLASRLSYTVPLLLGVLLIAWPHAPIPWLSATIVPRSRFIYWSAVALVAAGLGFSVWARLHLGSNWSGAVTLKEQHELIRSGPYRWVRHPIYTGLLLGLLGSAIARDEWRGLLGFAIATVGIVRKLRIEEHWMRELFGDEYVRYSSEVAALLPFVF
jgi:protein-S-isoprenylcysteine O-methyltransferase Ste14